MFKIHVKRTLLFGLLGLIAATIYYFVAPKVYEATTEMIVGNDVNQQASPSYATSTYTTDVEKILREGQSSGTLTELQVLRGEAVFLTAYQKVQQEHPSELSLDPSALKQYYNMYDVEAEKDAGLAIVRARAYQDPTIAEDLANAVAQSYLDIRRRAANQAVAHAVAYAQIQVQSTQQDLARVTKELSALKGKTNFVDPVQTPQQLLQMQEFLQQQRDQTASQLSGFEAQLASDRAQLASAPQYTVAQRGRQRSAELIQEEGANQSLRQQLSQAQSTYSSDSPQVKSLQQQLADSNSRLAQYRKNLTVLQSVVDQQDPVYLTIKTSLANDSAHVKNLQSTLSRFDGQLAAISTKVAALPASEAEVSTAQRQYDVLDLQYRQQEAMLQDLKDRSQAYPTNVQILGAAQALDIPISPDPRKTFLLGIVIFLAIGMFVSFGIEALRMRVYTSQQLSEFTGLPVAAVSPSLPGSARMLPGKLGEPQTLLESFRYMAFAWLARENQPEQIVMFTGVGGRSGCSTAASQFATSVARAGVSVLLVDMDLRRKRLSRVYGKLDQSGIGDLLGKTALKSSEPITYETAEPNLRILPAGTMSGLAVSDLPAAEVVEFLNSLKGSRGTEGTYRLVVLDLPPCDVFADAASLAAHVDETVLVISAKRTSIRLVPTVQELMKQAGAEKIRLVLNDADPSEEAFARRFRPSPSNA